MEIQGWILTQIIVDILIALVLILFIFSQFRKKDAPDHIKPSLRKAEEILAEIEKLTKVMGKNLEEKRELSVKIVEQMEQVIARAEKSRNQLQKIVKDCNTNPDGRRGAPEEMDRTRHSINTLLSKGIARNEISRHLGIPLAEIDLLLKLQT